MIKFFKSFFIVCVIVSLLGAVGYVKNIVKLVEHRNDPIVTEEVVRGVGVIFPPVGMVMGYID